MPFTGSEGSAISRDVARTLINNFQQSALFQDIKGGFIGRDILLKILEQQDCVGVRYFFALNDSDLPTIVLVGEDSKGVLQADGTIAEEFPLCPPFCWVGSGLEE